MERLIKKIPVFDDRDKYALILVFSLLFSHAYM